MPRIVFVLADGACRVVPGRSGATLMDAALDNGIEGIRAQCGGGCTCATCHCWIDPAFADRIPPPVGDEVELLEFVWGRDARSRLACQVVIDDALDGLRVEVPARQA